MNKKNKVFSSFSPSDFNFSNRFSMRGFLYVFDKETPIAIKLKVHDRDNGKFWDFRIRLVGSLDKTIKVFFIPPETEEEIQSTHMKTAMIIIKTIQQAISDKFINIG